MDGPISASELAGPASQQAASVQHQSRVPASTEKVDPVSEGSSSRSTGRDEVRESAKREERPEYETRRPEAQPRERKQPPAYVVEVHRKEEEAQGSAGARPEQTKARESDEAQSAAEADEETRRRAPRPEAPRPETRYAPERKAAEAPRPEPREAPEPERKPAPERAPVEAPRHESARGPEQTPAREEDGQPSEDYGVHEQSYSRKAKEGTSRVDRPEGSGFGEERLAEARGEEAPVEPSGGPRKTETGSEDREKPSEGEFPQEAGFKRPSSDERTATPPPYRERQIRTEAENRASDLRTDTGTRSFSGDESADKPPEVAGRHTSKPEAEARADESKPPRTDAPAREEDLPAKDSPRPEYSQDLAEAIGRAKERWAEVNRDIAEARDSAGQDEERAEEEEEDRVEEDKGNIQSFPDPSRYALPGANGNTIYTPRFSPSPRSSLTTKALDPAAPLGPPEVAVSSAGQRQAAIRYQSFAMALSNPQQERPVIDVFV